MGTGSGPGYKVKAWANSGPGPQRYVDGRQQPGWGGRGGPQMGQPMGQPGYGNGIPPAMGMMQPYGPGWGPQGMGPGYGYGPQGDGARLGLWPAGDGSGLRLRTAGNGTRLWRAAGDGAGLRPDAASRWRPRGCTAASVPATGRRASRAANGAASRAPGAQGQAAMVRRR